MTRAEAVLLRVAGGDADLVFAALRVKKTFTGVLLYILDAQERRVQCNADMNG